MAQTTKKKTGRKKGQKSLTPKETAKLVEEITSLRNMRMGWKEIAAELGHSHSHLYKLYHRARKDEAERNEEAFKARRLEETEFAEQLMRRVNQDIIQAAKVSDPNLEGFTDPKARAMAYAAFERSKKDSIKLRMEGYNLLKGLSQYIAKLNSLEAARKIDVDVSVHEQFDPVVAEIVANEHMQEQRRQAQLAMIMEIEAATIEAAVLEADDET